MTDASTYGPYTLPSSRPGRQAPALPLDHALDHHLLDVGDGFGRGFEGVGLVAGPDGEDGLALDALVDAVGYSFDFREFGHDPCSIWGGWMAWLIAVLAAANRTFDQQQAAGKQKDKLLVEAWDLLDVLSRGDESVLGNEFSRWRKEIGK